MNPTERFSKQEVEKIVVMVRLDLYNHGLPCGPKAIRKQMGAEHVTPLPSESAISRILSQRCLTHGRTGWYAEDNPESAPPTPEM